MNTSKFKTVKEVYEENATFWAEQRSQSTFFEKPYMDWVLSFLNPGDTVLDLGCGSGEPIAQYFMKNGMKVRGVDASSEMIKIAKSKFPEGEWSVIDMRLLNLEKKFSAVIAWDSFFHLTFTEQEQMFPIFKAHLKSGGVLVFTSGPDRGEAMGEMNKDPLYHASLSPDEYRDLLKKNGLKEFLFRPNDKNCGGHSVWQCIAD